MITVLWGGGVLFAQHLEGDTTLGIVVHEVQIGMFCAGRAMAFAPIINVISFEVIRPSTVIWVVQCAVACPVSRGNSFSQPDLVLCMHSFVRAWLTSSGHVSFQLAQIMSDSESIHIDVGHDTDAEDVDTSGSDAHVDVGVQLAVWPSTPRVWCYVIGDPLLTEADVTTGHDFDLTLVHNRTRYENAILFGCCLLEYKPVFTTVLSVAKHMCLRPAVKARVLRSWDVTS